MISYAPLWATMKQKGITTYYLRNKSGDHSINDSTICRRKAGDSVSTNTLDTLCKIIDCEISDILAYIKE